VQFKLFSVVPYLSQYSQKQIWEFVLPLGKTPNLQVQYTTSCNTTEAQKFVQPFTQIFYPNLYIMGIFKIEIPHLNWGNSSFGWTHMYQELQENTLTKVTLLSFKNNF